MNAFVRFNTDHYTETSPDNFTPSTAFNNLNTPNVTIGLQNTFSSNFFNDARFGFDRAEFSQGQNTPFPFALQITPFGTIDSPSGSIRNDNSFTGLDDATFMRGVHNIKAGFTVRRVQENKASPNTPDETIEYNSTATFLQNLIDSDSYAGAVPVTGQRLTEYFAYVMDQFKLGQTLNLNLGVRYENFGVDHEVLNRFINADPINCPNVICASNTPWYYTSNLLFSPRIGVIWSPAQFGGKVAIRSASASITASVSLAASVNRSATSRQNTLSIRRKLQALDIRCLRTSVWPHIVTHQPPLQFIARSQTSMSERSLCSRRSRNRQSGRSLTSELGGHICFQQYYGERY